MLDPCDLSLEGIERLCQADLTWKLVPLYDCPGEEGKACVVFVCPQLAILVIVFPIKRNSRGEHPAALKFPPPALNLPLLPLFSF